MFPLFRLVTDKLVALGFNSFGAAGLAHLSIALVVIVAALVANLVARKHLLSSLGFMVRRSKNTWDDVLFEKHVFDRLSHLAPALVLFFSADFYPNEPEFLGLIHWIQRAAYVYMFLVGINTAFAVFDAIVEIYSNYEVSRSRPIKGYFQAVKVVLALLTVLLVISLLTGQSPWLLVSGLGALTAVLLLIFKDSIMGVVAGIQLAGNNLVQQGDWIEVPNAGADGDVIDVSLTTVKVQNWNKTITSIPIYHLVSEAFTNWRGMYDSGGRRIKRSLNIDLSSIDFTDDEALAGLETLALLGEEVATIRSRLAAWQKAHPDNTNPANEPRPVNISLFRKYTAAFLHEHGEINEDMTFLVRQLQPTSEGVGIEIYVFCKDQRWVQYETVQADIIEHLIAVLPQFGLRIFQKPSGEDISRLEHVVGVTS